MKRTINEIYDLINQKIENARRDMALKKLAGKPNEATIIYGEIEAYTDIKILIESSGLIKTKEDLIIIKILKNNLYVNTEYTEEDDYEISIKELYEEEKEAIKQWLEVDK